MSEQEIKTVDFDDFQEVADSFIERSSHGYGEMSASAFFELLFEKMSERVNETIEVEGEIVDNQLVLLMPMDVETAVQVRKNEILVGDRRIVVRLKGNAGCPTVN
jgi:hypothetical protein